MSEWGKINYISVHKKICSASEVDNHAVNNNHAADGSPQKCLSPKSRSTCMIMICDNLGWFWFSTIYVGFNLYHFWWFCAHILAYDLKIVMVQKNIKEEEKTSPFDLIWSALSLCLDLKSPKKQFEAESEFGFCHFLAGSGTVLIFLFHLNGSCWSVVAIFATLLDFFELFIICWTILRQGSVFGLPPNQPGGGGHQQCQGE